VISAVSLSATISYIPYQCLNNINKNVLCADNTGYNTISVLKLHSPCHNPSNDSKISLHVSYVPSLQLIVVKWFDFTIGLCVTRDDAETLKIVDSSLIF